MKAQGLSVSFVVVAALAILVLVLGVAFLMGAFSANKQSASMQQAKSACNDLCSQIQAQASTIDLTTTTSTSCSANKLLCKDASSAYTKYCKAQFTIGGQSYSCSTLAPCTVTDSYGNPIKVDCSGYDSSTGKCTSCS